MIRMRANAARRWLAGGAACTGLFMGAFSFAQAPLKTTLPASAPTTFVPPASSISSTPQRGPDPAQRARVQVSGRTLQITAEDSSLNQILRDIARDTGMKVTGGVADERVYGVYGPADISAVLTRLFDGMGTNMLLVEDARQQPTELILTPQHGGVTPPGPFAGRRDEDDAVDLPPPLQPHVQAFTPTASGTQRPAQAAQGSAPLAGTGNSTGTNPGDIPSTAANAGVPTTTVQSPNGVKTPQQIYEQLMKMQQGTAKPGTTTTPQ
jgi:hypothetical protein